VQIVPGAWNRDQRGTGQLLDDVLAMPGREDSVLAKDDEGGACMERHCVQ
jgi:hypothetical protein